MNVRRVIRLYYGFQFFFALLLWVPIFYEFQKKIGLSDTQIFAIQSIYYLVFCLLEIPTGLLADWLGHRLCMISGAMVLVVAGIFPIFAQSYAGILVHFLLVALARSLISGASSAYIYDYLRLHGDAGEYKKVEGNARAYGLVGKVALWAVVGFLMEWHLTLPYWLTLGANALAVGFALALPNLVLDEVRKPDSQVGTTLSVGATVSVGATDRVRATFAMFLRAPILPLLMVQGIAIFVLGRIVQVNLFQPLLSSKGFSVASYGAVMSFMTLFETIGSFLPGKPGLFPGRHRMSEIMRMSDLNSVYVLTLTMAGALLGLVWAGQWGVLAGLALFSFAMGLSFPIQRQLMNDAIPDSRYRATLLSIESIIDRAVNAWVAALMGAFVARGAVGEFLRISSYVTIGSVFVLFAFIHWARKKSPTPATVVSK